MTAWGDGFKGSLDTLKKVDPRARGKGSLDTLAINIDLGGFVLKHLEMV